jgi:hypothetical protein
MEEFTWDAVPSQRQRKTEKYDYPVMTMAALAKPGAGRKFSFNKAAQELLNIKGEDRVSFGFNNDRTIVAICKAGKDSGFKLTKTCTFSDKKIFEFISKSLKLSNDIENEFKISDNTGYYSLELLDVRADIRPELGTIDAEYTMNSAHRDEDCEECEEEAKEMTDEQETEFINKVELDTPNGVESQW